MSLTNVNFGAIVKKQYQSKMRVYFGVFSSLTMVQVIGFLLSLGGTGSTGSSDGNWTIQVTNYNGNIILTFTMIWAFVIAILLTTEAYRNDHYAFVANRKTSQISQFLILVTTSVVGGLSATMASLLFKSLIFVWHSSHRVMGYPLSFKIFFMEVVVVILYLLLIQSAGYLIGLLWQFNRAIILVILVLIILDLFLSHTTAVHTNLLVDLIGFFAKEPSPLFFITKVLVTTVVFMVMSLVIAERMEVRP